MTCSTLAARALLSGRSPSLGQGDIPLADLIGPPPEIPWQPPVITGSYTSAAAETASAPQTETGVRPLPATASRRLLEFAEGNMAWILGGTVALVALLVLTGGKR